MSAGLKDALRLVETRGTAPLARVKLGAPDAKASSARWLAYNTRLAEANLVVIEELMAAGAVIGHDRLGGHVITFAGVRASSTAGLYRLLASWRDAAQKRLIGGAK